MTFKEIVEEILLNIKAFLAQPITPTVTMRFVIDNNGSWNGNSNNGKYSYYWIGDFKTGYQVKVKKNLTIQKNLRRWAKWNLVN